jgi:hypothetical protein
MHAQTSVWCKRACLAPGCICCLWGSTAAAAAALLLQELQAMMDPASGLHWSPWFRIIAKHFLPTWWQDLPTTLMTNKHVDTATLHKVDC